MRKKLNITNEDHAKKSTPDLEIFGNTNLFQLICKASSKYEGWMKSTKAMNIAKLGCVIQVSTQHINNIAEAVCFVPGARIHEAEDGYRCIVKGLVGVEPREISCPECSGEGTVTKDVSEPGDTPQLTTYSCDLCWGSGKLMAEPVMRLSE